MSSRIGNILTSSRASRLRLAVGRTGSGKSSIFNALFGSLEATSTGTICIGDVDIREWKLEQIRQFISLVSQGEFISTELLISSDLRRSDAT